MNIMALRASRMRFPVSNLSLLEIFSFQILGEAHCKCGTSFLKFPLYRYGYSYLISLIIFINSLVIFKYDTLLIKKIFKYILILTLVVFSSKQLIRMKNNYNLYSIWPNIYSFIPYKKNVNISEKLINKNFKIFVSQKECMYSKSPCTNTGEERNIIHKKLLNYDVILLNKD